MLVALTAGVGLARARKFEAHKRTQTAGVILSVVVAVGFMGLPYLIGLRIPGEPAPSVHGGWLVVVHAVTGILAVAAGVFVVLGVTGVGGHRLEPRNFKRLMRGAYLMYAIAILLGIAIRLGLAA